MNNCTVLFCSCVTFGCCCVATKSNGLMVWSKYSEFKFLVLLDYICVTRQDLDGKKSINSRVGNGGAGGRVTFVRPP